MHSHTNRSEPLGALSASGQAGQKPHRPRMQIQLVLCSVGRSSNHQDRFRDVHWSETRTSPGLHLVGTALERTDRIRSCRPNVNLNAVQDDHRARGASDEEDFDSSLFSDQQAIRRDGFPSF
jgi:hypothetical protein